MTLLDAKEYDSEKERKKRKQIITTVVLVLVVGFLMELTGSMLLHTPLWFLYWSEERVADHFFDALQKQDYETGYGIWMHDPQWQQHPDQHPKYRFNEFYRDWGPGGEWGLIKSQKVYGASSCPGGGSGIVVDVVINDRAQHAQVWVEKADKTLSFPPCELIFR